MKYLLCLIFGHRWYGVSIDAGVVGRRRFWSACTRCGQKIEVNELSCSNRDALPVLRQKMKRRGRGVINEWENYLYGLQVFSEMTRTTSAPKEYLEKGFICQGFSFDLRIPEMAQYGGEKAFNEFIRALGRNYLYYEKYGERSTEPAKLIVCNFYMQDMNPGYFNDYLLGCEFYFVKRP